MVAPLEVIKLNTKVMEFFLNEQYFLLNIGYVSNETNSDVRMYTLIIYFIC